jgi:hypothetical protein
MRGVAGRPVALARALAAASVLLLVAACLDQGGDPLRGPTEPNLSGLGVSVGEQVTWGAAVLVNEGSEPVELESVSLAGDMIDPKVARVEEISVHEAGPRIGLIGIVNGRGYETVPADRRSPVKGALVEPQSQPGSGLAVLVTVTALQNGKWRADELVVTYRVDGATRTMRTPSGFAVCVHPGGGFCDIDIADETG